MLIDNLKKLVIDNKANNYSKSIIINILKEYLQYPVLSYIYKEEKYQNFIFMGGSALRIIYKLPRLSEDLDFNLRDKNFDNLNLEEMAINISQYFKTNWQIDINYKVQGNTRLYLKFPILKQLNIAEINDSDFLYIKIEPQKEDFKDSETELNPISKDSFNFICQSYNLKFLMTGKISAILERNWFKGKDNEIKIKGRDYYDLYWYLSQNIEPDYSNLKERFDIKNKQELKKALREQINKKVDAKQLFYDLENFFPDQEFIKQFCQNYQLIMNKYLN